MDTTACHQLADRFAKKAEGGLVDVKFLLRNLEEAAAEEVCEEVEEFYVAMEDANRVTPLDFGDLAWK